MNILGISAFYHDSAAALIVDGEVIPPAALDRGLRVLRTLAATPGGLSITALAAEIGVNRTVVDRLVATLEQHGLARRDPGGRLHVGLGVLSLARSSELGVGMWRTSLTIADETRTFYLIAMPDAIRFIMSLVTKIDQSTQAFFNPESLLVSEYRSLSIGTNTK